MSTRPLAPFGRRRAPVTRIEDIGAYRVLHVADPDGPEPWPGQFYMLAAAERWGAGEGERPYVPRAFSFLGAGDGALSFMFEDVGPGTHRLGELAPGDELWLLGPLGQGFSPPDADRAAVLAGGGVGVPPLVAWAAELRRAGVAYDAILGFRDGARAPAAALLPRAVVATDDGSAGHHGPVTEPLAERLRADSAVVVYACGPPGMLEAVRAECAARDVEVQLALEAGMACGFGACFGCAVPVAGGGYARVCVDGPVFAGTDLEAVPAHP